MPGLSLRLRKVDRDLVVQAAEQLELSPAAFIAEALEKARAGEFPVVVGEKATGEVRLSAIVSQEVKEYLARKGEEEGMRPNEWALHAVVSYARLVLSDPSTDATDILDEAFDREAMHANGMHYRRQQHSLARAILNHLSTGAIGLNEASTGTGKAYACIAAANAFAKASGQKVVVATFTRALQKQLEKTASMLEMVTGKPVRCAAVYGKRNYVSPVHLEAVLNSESGISKEDRMACLEWRKTTKSWLASELHERVDPDTFPINLVTIPDDCTDERALQPYRQAVASAAEADVIITSHHMLLYAMMGKADFLGFRPQHVIVDEAHLLEMAAHSVLGAEISLASVRWAARRLINYLQQAGKRKKAREFKEWLDNLEAIESAIVESAKGRDVLPLIQRSGIDPSMTSSIERLKKLSSLPRLPKTLKLLGPNDYSSYAELRDAASVFSQIKEAVANANAQESDVFASLSPVRKYVRVITTSRWFASRDLERILWSRVRAASLVSATIYLPVANGENSAVEFVNSLGLRNLRYQTEPAFFEPWVYDNASVFIAPPTWPEPSSEDGGNQESREAWLEKVVALVEQLNRIPVSDDHGGIMVLCTSYDDAEAIGAALSNRGERKVMVYRRGDDMRNVQSRFKEANGNAVLVALGGFWTGVDFPGRLLTDLVITRLPLLSAADPMVVSRFLYAKNKMGFQVAFASIMLPRMGITLRQGIGRLIRSPNDYGRVYITDPRVHTRPNWRVKTLLRRYEPLSEIKMEEEKGNMR